MKMTAGLSKVEGRRLKGLVGTIVALLVTMGARGEETRWAVESPNGELAITVSAGAEGRLTYTVERGRAGARTVVLVPSALGLRREDQSFEKGLRFVSAGPETAIEEIEARLHGKRSPVRHRARQRTLTFTNAGGARLELVLRAADDGVAFRYRFPETDRNEHRVLQEGTGFRLPPGTTAWMLPQEVPDKYDPAYEDYFREVPVGTSAPTASGWSFPALFKVEGGRHWVLITEAGLDESYCGTRLATEAPEGHYRIRLPEAGEGKGVGASEPSSRLPWTMPWRVLIVGSLATVAESTLVDDVSAPPAFKDTSWIKPGRASWSWWSDSPSPKSEAALMSFVDLAAEMGWEYSLVDANWNELPEGALRRLLAQAKAKGVRLLLWYNSGGPHNDVSEAPRDRMHTADVRRAEMARLREWGVAGVKVDFWHSDKQDRIRQYLDVLRDAAAEHLLVDFHGSTLPRGWARTWPNLVSMEGVLGAEQYKFLETFPERAPAHNTVLPYTRNVVGSMDYTPVTFTDHQYPRRTTDAHELALSVVFESGVQHFADSVAAYRALPAPARDFLKAVPAAWDDTRLLAGEPGRQAVFARRSGEDWYVGGLNGEDTAQPFALSLSFLPAGSYRLTLITDGGQPRGALTAATRVVTASDRAAVDLLPRGGFVARLVKER
jgi:alpha-glucosidase